MPCGEGRARNGVVETAHLFGRERHVRTDNCALKLHHGVAGVRESACTISASARHAGAGDVFNKQRKSCNGIDVAMLAVAVVPGQNDGIRVAEVRRGLAGS